MPKVEDEEDSSWTINYVLHIFFLTIRYIYHFLLWILSSHLIYLLSIYFCMRELMLCRMSSFRFMVASTNLREALWQREFRPWYKLHNAVDKTQNKRDFEVFIITKSVCDWDVAGIGEKKQKTWGIPNTYEIFVPTSKGTFGNRWHWLGSIRKKFMICRCLLIFVFALNSEMYRFYSNSSTTRKFRSIH